MRYLSLHKRRYCIVTMTALTILINRNKPRDKQIQGVMHELSHINGDDFYSELQAGIIEQITHDAEHDADISGFTFYSNVI